MSLLGSHNNEFEKKLKKHLGDTEYKPAESLWDRIDQEVNRPPFEHKVEGKIGRYELAPKPETWEYIEAHLPPEPRSWKRAGKIWYGLVALLFIAGAFIGYQLSETGTGELAQVQQPQAQEAAASETPTGSAKTSVAENMVPENNPALGHQPAGVNNELLNHTTDQAGTPSASGREPAAVRLTPQQNTSRQQPIATNTKPVTETDIQARTRQVMKGTTSAPAVEAKSEPDAVRSQNSQEPSADVNNPLAIAHTAPKHSDPKPVVPESVTPVISENTVSQKDHEPAPVDAPQATPTAQKELTEPMASPPVNQPNDTTQVAALKSSDTGKPIAQANDSMNRLPFAAIDDHPPVRLSISIMAGMHQSNMRLVAPANMQANKALRGQVESPEFDFTGGFLLDYKVTERVLISSGVIISGFSMGMNYDASPSGRSADVKPGVTYEHEDDTITAGNQLSNRIKYSWTEIPLFVTYRFRTQKRLGFEVRGGVSYARIGTVDVNMVGQDNIGVLVIKSQESFPVFRNSFFAHVYAGISFKLNETVSLNAMPYFRYSLNSMIKNENWIQQYPWMGGMSLGLRKSF